MSAMSVSNNGLHLAQAYIAHLKAHLATTENPSHWRNARNKKVSLVGDDVRIRPRVHCIVPDEYEGHKATHLLLSLNRALIPPFSFSPFLPSALSLLLPAGGPTLLRLIDWFITSCHFAVDGPTTFLSISNLYISQSLTLNTFSSNQSDMITTPFSSPSATTADLYSALSRGSPEPEKLRRWASGSCSSSSLASQNRQAENILVFRPLPTINSSAISRPVAGPRKVPPTGVGAEPTKAPTTRAKALGKKKAAAVAQQKPAPNKAVRSSTRQRDAAKAQKVDQIRRTTRRAAPAPGNRRARVAPEPPSSISAAGGARRRPSTLPGANITNSQNPAGLRRSRRLAEDRLRKGEGHGHADARRR